MSLQPGTKIGPYEITGSIGAGGMGEVYRAHDHRLDRDVAIKILPASFAQDSDRLKRFEQEARAVGALNHPNILAIYDIGQHEGAPYLVSELLEGEDLRKHMDGSPLPQRAAVEYAAQIAHGLAAAHEKGVVHRDLKPDNIFILRDGRVKILDFGLAKLVPPEALSNTPHSGATLGVTASAPATSPGQVMGTVGYMSPEQVRGHIADHRSDIFSFGTILYEMLTGHRAFKRDSSIETMTAILKEDPPELSSTVHNVQPGLERILRHCLEKAPERRFQSARDLAFDLESLTQGTGTTTRALVSARVEVNRWRWVAIAMAAVIAALLLFYAGRKTAHKEAGVYKQLTFQRGFITRGRFSPDGESVFFTANWNGLGRRLYTGRAKALNWQSQSNEPLEVVSVSKDGDVLVLRNVQIVSGFAIQATLAMIPATGGSPKDLMDGVQDADFSPDGKTIVVSRVVNGRYEIQSPPGTKLYQPAEGWASDVRFSPDGKSISFFEHPTMGDARGFVNVIDQAGKQRKLTAIYSNIAGAAWHPDGELWFTASETGLNQALYAVDSRGTVRVVERVPGNLTLLDISAGGRVLLSHDTLRRGLFAYSKKDNREVDLAWFDWSNLRGVSRDGQWVLLDEEGEGGGADYTLFLRNINADPPTRLGSGQARDLSPDQKWVLAMPVNEPRKAMLLPTGVGETRTLPGNIEHLGARFMADSRHIIFAGRDQQGNLRSYLQDIDGGEPKPITEEGFAGFFLTPDEKKLFVTGPGGKRYLYDLVTKAKEDVAWSPRQDFVLRFADATSAYVARRDPDHPESLEIQKLDLKSGRRTTLRAIRTEATGLVSLGPVSITPDGSSYAYSSLRTFSDLFVVDGLK